QRSRKTSEETLATRRTNERTRLGERSQGRPERISPIGGGGLLDEAGRTAGFVATRELYPGVVRIPLAGKPSEGGKGRLLLAAERQQTGLPTGDGALIA